MSTARDPLSPVKPTDKEAVEVLKEHMDEPDAVELVERLGLDTTPKAPWPVVRDRILKQLTPQ